MPADVDHLGREYSSSEPKEGRLARALNVDIPVLRELGNEILGDFDEQASGVGWWAPHPGTSRRILIGDHLFTCVRSVETNLIEARLHLMEAMDFWQRESDFNARAVSIDRDGRVKVAFPERKRPLDEAVPVIATLHTVGFVRAIAGALDCFGAVIVGVLALRTGLLRADLDSARRALGTVKGGDPGEEAQLQVRLVFGETHSGCRSSGLVSLGFGSEKHVHSPRAGGFRCSKPVRCLRESWTPAGSRFSAPT